MYGVVEAAATAGRLAGFFTRVTAPPAASAGGWSPPRGSLFFPFFFLGSIARTSPRRRRGGCRWRRQVSGGARTFPRARSVNSVAPNAVSESVAHGRLGRRARAPRWRPVRAAVERAREQLALLRRRREHAPTAVSGTGQSALKRYCGSRVAASGRPGWRPISSC